MSQESHGIEDSVQRDPWYSLYKIGGAAALVAGILCRRNIAAEMGILNIQPAPVTMEEWFDLLGHNRFLGLIYLNALDIINYLLIGLMFLALFTVLKKMSKSWMTVVLAFALAGSTVYFSSNTAFSLLSLSNQYALAVSEAQKSILLTAGQAILSLNRFSDPLAFPGTGGYISLTLIAMAGLICSIVMIRSKVFGRMIGYVGIAANALDLAYAAAFVLIPAADNKILTVCFLPAAGLFFMAWHIMIGWRLCRLTS